MKGFLLEIGDTWTLSVEFLCGVSFGVVERLFRRAVREYWGPRANDPFPPIIYALMLVLRRISLRSPNLGLLSAWREFCIRPCLTFTGLRMTLLERILLIPLLK